MKKQSENTITVFEHEAVRLSDTGECKITPTQLTALQKFGSTGDVPYFTLLYNGIKFCEYVGVLQVGNLTIEVLPKVDRGSDDKNQWKKILIDMLRKVGTFDVSASSETSLKIKNNSILDIYIESFLVQVERLVHQGLIKKYRKQEDNCTALKGKLVFAKHISKNIIHKERFFVKYTVYDQLHVLNQILFKTLNLIRVINTNSNLQSRVSTLLLNFPEMPDVKASESLFENIVYNRKNESYRQAMLIARLLLLNYHPDINSGRNHVLALMFDMNLLWERFVYVSLRKHFAGGIQPQQTKAYWKLDGCRVVSLKPDVVLVKDKIKYILDTKWKLPANNKPGHSDLQQMYAYTKYFDSEHTILCYPGKKDDFYDGRFYDENAKGNNYPCSVLRIGIDVSSSISSWQNRITTTIEKQLERFAKS